MAIGISRAPTAKFKTVGERHGGEIVDFRVVQKKHFDTDQPQYFQRDEDGVTVTSRPYAEDGRPNDPVVQYEITVDTGVEDNDGDTERRLFIDPQRGRKGTPLEGMRGGDALASALKRAKAHRVGLEIGGKLFLTWNGKLREGPKKPETNTWSAEYEPPVGGPGSGKPVDEMPWLVGGDRYDRAAEMARWSRENKGAAAPALTPAESPAEPASDPGLAARQQEALARVGRAQASSSTARALGITRPGPDDEPPF